MKITIKTIKNETFPIEITAQEPTVIDLKQAIFKEKQIQIEAQNLIFKGVLLTDAKSLKESKIEEGANVVLMVKKNLNIAQAQPAQQPVQQVQQSQPAQQQQAVAQPVQQQQPQQQQQEHAQEKIDQLMQMGFMKSDVISALDAANSDLAIATEYLLGGMDIEEFDDQNIQPQVGGAPQMDVASLLQQNPEMVQQFISQNPQLAQSIEQNPGLLQNLVQQLQNQGEGDEEDDDEEENGDDNAMYYQNALNQNIDMSLNEQDEQAILRLMGLGFDRETVVQAYLACMKNEDFAANHLFDNQN